MRKVSVRAIIMHQGKLFCVHLKDYEGAIAGGSWCLPGGGVDPGEALLPALHREMIEEIGVAPKIGNLLYVQQFAHDKTDYLEFFFHVVNAQDYLDVDLSRTSHGAVEIEEAIFVDPKTTPVLPRFLSTEPITQKIADGSAVQFFSDGSEVIEY